MVTLADRALLDEKGQLRGDGDEDEDGDVLENVLLVGQGGCGG